MRETEKRDLAQAMLRLHGETTASSLAWQYAKRSELKGEIVGFEKWQAVAIFLETFLSHKNRHAEINSAIASLGNKAIERPKPS